MFRKNRIGILPILAIILLSLTSYSGVYPIPVYYQENYGDGVIHKYTRSVYHDIHGNIEKTTTKINSKFSGETTESITEMVSYRIYLESRKVTKAKMNEIIESL